MKIRKMLRSKQGVSNILSVILITGIMVSSIAITYSYIIPTIDRGRIESTISTSALFLTKIDGVCQSLMYDGVGASRDLEIDAYSGAFEFLSQGINIRAFIDGTMYFPLPGLTFGLLRITIPSDIGILTEGIPEYLMGSPYDPLAVLDEGSGNPAMLTLVRTFQETYELELWYRLLLHVRDTGINGVIDVSIVVVEFESAEAIRGLNEGTFNLVVNKTRVEVNPTRYGFNVNNDPITTSGDDFEITANKITGPETIYSSTGTRTAVNFNLVVITLGFQIISLG